MKGVMLDHFLQFLESRHGPVQAQRIVNAAELESGGAYTSVGVYSARELSAMVEKTAEFTGESSEDIIGAYAQYMMPVFKEHYGVFFEGKTSGIEMLRTINDHIHVEVKKLYSDANLPTITLTEDDNGYRVSYRSSRPFAKICEALVTSCLDYWGDKEKVVESRISDDHRQAEFIIAVPEGQ